MANLTSTSGQTAFLIKLLRVPEKLAFSIPKSRGMNNCMKPIKIKRTKKRRKETVSHFLHLHQTQKHPFSKVGFSGISSVCDHIDDSQFYH